MPIRIVIGGVPNCGKSTITASLYIELQKRGINISVHELDVFENTLPCILGNETWEERAQVKSGNWTDPCINIAINTFNNDAHQFVLGDLPGIIDKILETMVAQANLAIVIGKDQESLQKWLNFFSIKNIPVIQKIISYLDEYSIPTTNYKDCIFIANLKRQIVVSEKINEIVDNLLSHCTG